MKQQREDEDEKCWGRLPPADVDRKQTETPKKTCGGEGEEEGGEQRMDGFPAGGTSSD